MAAIKGEVPLKVTEGPAAGEYVLLLDFNALCDAEDEFPGIMNGSIDISSFRKIRRLVQFALATHHPHLDEREVGDIIQGVGVVAAAEKVTEAMKATFPEAKTAGKAAAPARAGAGTGR
ncbi:MAG: hypothetical protein FJX25_18485 [Alphaproteobacteria bacterium]|nr:hypothetical protein [Alphaproteobacteria bacterium]